MVEVRWEIEGTELGPDAAQKALQRVLDYNGRALAGISCPVHSDEPWLIVRGSTVKTCG